MKRAGVDVGQVAVKPGPTGRACILSCGGQRTMVGAGTGGALQGATRMLSPRFILLQLQLRPRPGRLLSATSASATPCRDADW